MDTSAADATDLSDAEWELLRPLVEPQSRRGRPRRHALRTIRNALVSMLRTGCSWRRLPREWPPWSAVFSHFRRWRLDGAWERIHTVLRRRERVRRGRDPEPSAGSIDSHSVKTTANPSRRRARAARAATTGPSSWSGASATCRSTPKASSSRSPSRCTRPTAWTATGSSRCSTNGPGPSARAGSCSGRMPATTAGARARTRARTGPGRRPAGRSRRSRRSRPSTGTSATASPTSLPPEQIDWSLYLPAPGFHVIPRRWVAERTFAWLSHNRRLSKDYERLRTTSEAWISLAMIRLLLLRRLAPTGPFP